MTSSYLYKSFHQSRDQVIMFLNSSCSAKVKFNLILLHSFMISHLIVSMMRFRCLLYKIRARYMIISTVTGHQIFIIVVFGYYWSSCCSFLLSTVRLLVTLEVLYYILQEMWSGCFHSMVTPVISRKHQIVQWELVVVDIKTSTDRTTK